MKMSLTALLMSAVICFTVGCSNVIEKPEVIPDKTIVTEGTDMQVVTNKNDKITAESVQYLINCNDENMAISPVSLKGAMALVALSTEGVTQEEVLKALGCESVDGVSKWYAELQDYSNKLKSSFNPKTVEVANAVWVNTDNAIGKIHEPYRKMLNEKLGATCDYGDTQKLANKINSWANEKTHGLINQIVTPETIMESVLVLSNATYLKGSWSSEFNEIGTKEFKSIDGSKIKKDFISRSDGGLYYKDNSIECTTVSIGGGLQMVMAKGDQTKLFDAINKMERYDEVYIEMPKMEIESSWNFVDIKAALEKAGINKLFESSSEFVQVTEGNNTLELGNILQKCKVLTDENGIEAAAVTAITFDNACVITDKPTRAEFIADEPYYFYVYADSDLYSTDGNDSNFDELLFCGKYIK